MIGMSFLPFLVLLIISVAISLIVFFWTGFRIEGTKCRGLCPLIVIGWVGGWLGSPVLGYWWKPLSVCNVYVIPAILGTAALICLYVSEKRFWEHIFPKKQGE